MTTTAARGSPSGPAKIIKTTVTIDHGNVAANSVDVAPTAAVTGLRTTDVCIINPPAGGLTANLCMGRAYCSAAGVLTVPIINPTAGIIAAAARIFKVTILRFDS